MTKLLKLFLTTGLLLVPSLVASSRIVYADINVRAVSPEVIFQSSIEAWKQSNTEEAAYLFYAAKLRAVCDEQLFPPKAEGGNSPFIAFGALSQVIGESLNPEITNDPEAYKRVIDRINALNPLPEVGYKPSWEYKAINNIEEAKRSCLSYKEKVSKLDQRQSKLLLNKEYFLALKRIKEYNLSTFRDQPSQSNQLSIKKDILKLKEIELKEFGNSLLWDVVYGNE